MRARVLDVVCGVHKVGLEGQQQGMVLEVKLCSFMVWSKTNMGRRMFNILGDRIMRTRLK